jgi:hypothetical protein
MADVGKTSIKWPVVVGLLLLALPARAQDQTSVPPLVQTPPAQSLPQLQIPEAKTAQAQTPVAALPFIQWHQFVDPNEGSFSMDAPAGWRVIGGIARRNALQYWFWLSAFSPDGNTIIAFGDPESQSYILPNRMLAMAGFREGSLYNGGGGTLYTVSRYVPGLSFGQFYGQRHLPRFCSAIQMTVRMRHV